MHLSIFTIYLLLISSMVLKAEQPRVFIANSNSWEWSMLKGGARPQRVKIMKTFNDKCPQITVTIREHKANFTVFLEHEGGKDPIAKDNKVAVFDHEGDLIFTNSTRSLGNSVKNACETISRHSFKASK